MEQTFKHVVQSRQADQLTVVKQNLIGNSNAISSRTGTFAELSADVLRLLGIKKALD